MRVGDTLQLEEQLQDGFWKVKRNGTQSVMLLLDADDEKMRQSLVHYSTPLHCLTAPAMLMYLRSST